MKISSPFRKLPFPILAAWAVLAAPCSQAAVKLPAIFGDHMVLQQDGRLPVWGWADAGEEVTVTFGSQSEKATAGADGQWRVDLKPVPTSSTAQVLTVTGKNTVKFEDVLVGDVWVCSGQSNMEFAVSSSHTASKAVPASADQQLRLFVVAKKIALQPESDVQGKWVICGPDTLPPFSAVGYYFGQELRKSLQRPIGLIGTYWGGTPAEAWISLSGLRQPPPFTNYIDKIESIRTNYDQTKVEYDKQMLKYNEEQKQWLAEVGDAYNKVLADYRTAVLKAVAEGKPEPVKPQPSRPAPTKPLTPDGGPNAPTVLYNGMIAPLIPYGIKGAIWYQGESNAGRAKEYQTLFPRLITDWRAKWGEGDFPFLFVQLANYLAQQKEPAEGGWAYVREAQLMTLALPHTGMATAIDLGNGADIHPRDKLDVGLRLALAAKHVAYGQDLVYSGPIYDSFKVEGNKVRLTFKNRGGGLIIGQAPWVPAGTTPLPTKELAGFAITGADKNWAWGKATIDGDTVVVTSDAVTTPVAVRYDWATNPIGNLYNKEGLPAPSFRTDDWPEEPKPAPSPSPSPSATPKS